MCLTLNIHHNEEPPFRFQAVAVALHVLKTPKSKKAVEKISLDLDLNIIITVQVQYKVSVGSLPCGSNFTSKEGEGLMCFDHVLDVFVLDRDRMLLPISGQNGKIEYIVSLVLVMCYY